MIYSYKDFTHKLHQHDWYSIFKKIEAGWAALFPRYKKKSKLKRDSDGMWDGFLHLTSEDDQRRELRIEPGIDGKLDYLSFDGVEQKDISLDPTSWLTLIKDYYLFNEGWSGVRQSPVVTSNSKVRLKNARDNSKKHAITVGLSRGTSGEKDSDIDYLKNEIDSIKEPRYPAQSTQKPLPPKPIVDLGDVPAKKGISLPRTDKRTGDGGERNRQKK